ncbi:MAG TPA: glycosyltransferase [Chloroflexaceae bacterium]|nr:glycosyltransferase [Chloroflexaceae bacterium]
MTIRCTIGVLAYNEERNIVQVLRSLVAQRLYACEVDEILVIASGCTDRTVPLAQEFARQHPMVRVVAEAERAGKAAAINHLIALARSEVVVLVGADTLPDPLAVQHLVRPFADPTVGMTGARVIPLNDPRTFLGMVVQMLWRVHHILAQRWPKLGEMVAFRKVIDAIPVASATDEVALEALITARGYRLVYAPEAIVYNRGPQTYHDFLLQRRRIFAGHLQVAARDSYVASSMPVLHLVWLAYAGVRRRPDLLVVALMATLLELFARLLGWLDFRHGRPHHIWRQVRSTKQVAQPRQMGSLLFLQCRPASVSTRQLRRVLHRIPPEHGKLLWWDYQQGQVIFLLPEEQLAPEALSARVRALTGYLHRLGARSSPRVVFYRTIQLANLYDVDDAQAPRPELAPSPL